MLVTSVIQDLYCSSHSHKCARILMMTILISRLDHSDKVHTTQAVTFPFYPLRSTVAPSTIQCLTNNLILKTAVYCPYFI